MHDSVIINKINAGMSIRSTVPDTNKSNNTYNVSVTENNNKYCCLSQLNGIAV